MVLIALAEEELVGINLSEEHWPMIRLPYIASLHASAVTCSTLVSNLPEHIWNDIKNAGELQVNDIYCDTVCTNIFNVLTTCNTNSLRLSIIILIQNTF